VPSTTAIRALQTAILGGLGLKGRSITKIVLTLEVNEIPRLEIEEFVFDGTKADTLRTVLKGIEWHADTESTPSAV
jgi:hypothetical protein